MFSKCAFGMTRTWPGFASAPCSCCATSPLPTTGARSTVSSTAPRASTRPARRGARHLARQLIRDLYLTNDPAAAVLLDKTITGCLGDDVDEVSPSATPW
jgi:hypothetical protein